MAQVENFQLKLYTFMGNCSLKHQINRFKTQRATPYSQTFDNQSPRQLFQLIVVGKNTAVHLRREISITFFAAFKIAFRILKKVNDTKKAARSSELLNFLNIENPLFFLFALMKAVCSLERLEFQSCLHNKPRFLYLEDRILWVKKYETKKKKNTTAVINF